MPLLALVSPRRTPPSAVWPEGVGVTSGSVVLTAAHCCLHAVGRGADNRDRSSNLSTGVLFAPELNHQFTHTPGLCGTELRVRSAVADRARTLPFAKARTTRASSLT